MKLRGLLAVAFVLVLAACGSNNNQTTTPQAAVTKCTLDGVSFVALSGTADCTGGLGGVNVTYSAETPATRDDNNFPVTFTLPKESSSVTLTTNAEQGLKNGVTLTITRVAGNKLTAQLKGGTTDLNFTEDVPAAVDVTKPISFNVDIHSHGDAILEWAGKELGYEFQSRPTGKFWGFTVTNEARVTATKPPQTAKHHH